MIFLVKHCCWLALLITVVWSALNALIGGWDQLVGNELSLSWQIAFGLAGGVLALLINGVLHEALKRFLGHRYVAAFESYAREILDGMTWPAYLAGGFMAALAEEPFFRGFVLRSFDDPTTGIAVAALLFAICHWLRPSYFGFWLWAMWEGVFFGILLVVTGSLLVPMIAHGFHDVFAYRVFQALVGKDGQRHRR